MKTTIISALKVQLRRLETDKLSPEFKSAPLFLVVMINDEIAKINSLLRNCYSWDITTKYKERS